MVIQGTNSDGNVKVVEFRQQILLFWLPISIEARSEGGRMIFTAKVILPERSSVFKLIVKLYVFFF